MGSPMSGEMSNDPTNIFCHVPGRLSLLSSTSKYKGRFLKINLSIVHFQRRFQKIIFWITLSLNWIKLFLLGPIFLVSWKSLIYSRNYFRLLIINSKFIFFECSKNQMYSAILIEQVTHKLPDFKFEVSLVIQIVCF